MSSEISVSPEAYRSASPEAYGSSAAAAKYTPSQVARGASCLRGLALCIATLVGIALLGVVCSGLKGSFTNVVAFGPTVVALAGSGFLLYAASGAFKDKETGKLNKTIFIIAALVYAVICTLGALNIAGILTMKQVGIGYFGAGASGGFIILLTSCCLGAAALTGKKGSSVKPN